MLDFFQSLDRTLFYFGNRSLQNPLFDVVMPFITDLNKNIFAIIVVGILWILLIVKGGKNGRLAAILLLPAVALSDQINSSFLKFLIERPRPCSALPNVHLLVGCGSGYSFPSSHAVNNFACAILLSYFLPRWTWAFFTFAAVVSYSRIYVGVHYPADVLAGAIVGLLCGALVIVIYHWGEMLWRKIRQGEAKEL